ncbi:hypothetical protein G9464_00235 [Halostella sp. JP-L12]|uniref:hypothetical protein n=1 Tax=Halostella TaxID=1843185 RepID=UPI000EF85014|nr:MULTISPECIES: hypothetical protein [Halostella]NHN46024.1 hypothetical protein [Halostella sp. JP-L12]
MTDGIATTGSDDVSLPDRLERVGVVVGATLLLSLPMGVVGSHLLAAGQPAWVAGPLVFAPGLAVGILAATDRIPVPYGQIWSFSLVSWFATLVLLSVAGSNQLTADRDVVLASWLAGLLVGVAVAGRRELRDRLL